MALRTLLVTYKFPPLVGPRSIRWTNFCNRLTALGCDVSVLTIDPPSGMHGYDAASLTKVDPRIKTIRVKPGAFAELGYKAFPNTGRGGGSERRSATKAGIALVKRLAKNFADNCMFPDKYCSWIGAGEKGMIQVNGGQEYDVVISSAMPFSDHVLAHKLARRWRLPLVLDYGDPWVFNPIFPAWRRWIDRGYEKPILQDAEALIVTTEETKAGFLKNYSFLTADRIHVIAQSYDEDKYASAIPERGKRFRIVYTGIFYEDVREPHSFLEALRRTKDLDLEVVVAGETRQKYRDLVESLGLSDRVSFVGHVSHDRAISLQLGADLLLLFGWPQGHQVPGKLYEYIGARRPILSIRYDDKDIARRVVEAHRRGLTVMNDTEQIAKAIRSAYALADSSKREFGLEMIPDYTWSAQTIKLSEVLRSAVQGIR